MSLTETIRKQEQQQEMSKRSKEEREAFLEWNLKQIIEPLGFRLGPVVPYGRVDRSWWFFRGNAPSTEAVCAELKWRPKPVMGLTLFVTSLDPEDLAKQGVAGYAIGLPLFIYEVDYLHIDQDELLPDLISMSVDEEWPETFLRLGKELVLVEPKIWRDLWLLLQQSQNRC
jgi:hypothetical protein